MFTYKYQKLVFEYSSLSQPAPSSSLHMSWPPLLPKSQSLPLPLHHSWHARASARVGGLPLLRAPPSPSQWQQVVGLDVTIGLDVVVGSNAPPLSSSLSFVMWTGGRQDSAAGRAAGPDAPPSSSSLAPSPSRWWPVDLLKD